MVFVTGDTHAHFNKFSTDSFPTQKELSKEDTVIICGDFGGVWNDTKEERYWLDWLDSKNFTTVFVDGNHENFDRLYSEEFAVVDFHGGKAHKIRDSVFHLMRGYIYEFDGKKFFAFGGASSHDIEDGIVDPADFESEEALNKHLSWMYYLAGMYRFRVKGRSWWEQELPTQEEMDFGKKTLEENGNEVDFIITHCLPQSVASVFSLGKYNKDRLTEYFDEINGKVNFKKWYCGHYHTTKEVMSDYIILYHDIVRIV